MSNLDIDVAELRQLAADLTKAQSRSVAGVRAVVERGALNIKKDWQRRWSGHPRFSALPAAITYDVRYGLGRVAAEVGPDKTRRQGALGNIIEFGTTNNPPIPGGLPAAAAEAPQFVAALEALAADAILGR